MFNIGKFIAFLALLGLFSGCSHIPTSSQRLINAQESARLHGWKRVDLKSKPFNLTAFVSTNIEKKPLLTIYIEGDGLAWLNRTTPSLDPTPINPIGLSLALKHNTGNAAYLARPCQFNTILPEGCKIATWTNKRFSNAIIEASNQSIDLLKQLYGANTIQLIGFSGGGAIASLVAGKRNDVIRLVTISGNLNHALWTRRHRISPLTGSLNPTDYWQAVKNIPQILFIGGQDTVITPEIAYSYQAKFTSGIQPTIIVIPNFNHTCCWVKSWPDLLPALETTHEPSAILYNN